MSDKVVTPLQNINYVVKLQSRDQGEQMNQHNHLDQLHRKRTII